MARLEVTTMLKNIALALAFAVVAAPTVAWADDHKKDDHHEDHKKDDDKKEEDKKDDHKKDDHKKDDHHEDDHKAKPKH
jgi:hypothetical protein